MIRRTLCAVAGAALAVTALASPSSAAHEERWDPRDDGTWEEFGEIWGTEVDWDDQLVVKAWFDHYADGHTFLVDATGDKDPEFSIVWWTDDFGPENADRVTVRRNGKERCEGTAAYDSERPHQMRFTVPAGCLRLKGGVPAQVRVRARTFTAAADSNPVDRTRYTDWVRRG